MRAWEVDPAYQRILLAEPTEFLAGPHIRLGWPGILALGDHMLSVFIVECCKLVVQLVILHLGFDLAPLNSGVPFAPLTTTGLLAGWHGSISPAPYAHISHCTQEK